MKTDDVIKNLSSELKPDETHFYRSSALWWVGGTIGLLALFVSIVPLRADLGYQLSALFFQVETASLLALFSGSTWIAYRSAIPGLLGRREKIVGVVIAVLFSAVILSKLSISSLATEFEGEMSFYRGRCGPILLALSLTQAVLGMVLARRAAPTRLVITGFWVGVSAAAMGLFATQLICDHDNFLHLVIWHALPAGILVGTAAVAARRVLRW